LHTLILFAHGSRDPAWRAPFDALAARVVALRPDMIVEVAFLEHALPTLDDAVDAVAARGATAVTIVPLFLGVGGHLRKDLPALVAKLRERHPELALHTMPPLGEAPAVLEAIALWAAGRG